MTRIEVLTCAPEPARLACLECGAIVQTLYDVAGDGRYVCFKHLSVPAMLMVRLMEQESDLREALRGAVVTLLTREYEPIHLWIPAATLTMAEVCRQLLRDTRGMPSFETAVFIRAHTGIRPGLTFDHIGPHYELLSRRHYPHRHKIRPRGDTYVCPCESRAAACVHVEECLLEDAEHGRPPEIEAAARAAA